MRFVAALVISLALAAGFLAQSQPAGAAFHFMRIYAVMGGSSAGAGVQNVELRMTDPGQTFVMGHHICFFDAAGNPWARFAFTANVVNGVDEASILVGTSQFDAAWAAGSPDFTFSMANTTAIAMGADPAHPVVSPSGKVAFGTDSATMPSSMCQASFSVIDSVAYGSAYTGSVNFGTKFPSDLPTSGTQVLKLTTPICSTQPFSGSPCSTLLAPRMPPAPDNSLDYALLDANQAANNPRNNAGNSGPLSSDPDGDGIDSSVDPDDDGDSFLDVKEASMETDMSGSCSSDTTANNESPDRLPPDADDDRDADIGDVIALFNGKILNPPAYSRRSDFDADTDIDIGDVITGFGGGKILTKCAVFAFTNNTGGAVDDIHIVWNSAIAEVFSALDSDLKPWSNRTISGGGLVLDIDRPDAQGDLASGGQLTIVVRGASLVVSSCQWTLDGINKGAC